MPANNALRLRVGVMQAQLAGMCLLAVVLGGLVVRKAAADQLIAVGRYDAAITVGGSNRLAATRQAIAADLAGDFDGARSAATTALAIAPMTPAALRTIGLAEQAQGRLTDVGRWMNFSAALGWRDVATRVWLARTFILAGRPQDAVVHLDALIRQNVLTQPISRLLDRLADDDATRAQIVDSLAANPPWRDAYFTDVDRLQIRDVSARQAVLAGLRKAGHPVDRPALKRWVDRLITLGATDTAYRTWRNFAIDPKALSGGGVYDGRFMIPADGVEFPFEWTVADGGEIRPADGGAAGSASRVTLPSDASPDTVLLQQTLMLSPGRHILTMATDIAFAIAGAPVWRLECPPTMTLLPLSSSGASVADRAAFVVDIPAGCPFPILSLRAGDVTDTGQHWIADVAIRPLGR